MKRKSSQNSPSTSSRHKREEPMPGADALSVPAFNPPPLTIPDSLARWTGNLMYWVSSLGAQYYAQALTSLGLNPAQIAVLQVLGAEGILRQARLTDRTRIDKATMVGLLNGLEQQSLIERRPAARDKRAFEIHLTAQGQERLIAIEAVSQAAEAEFYGVLSPQDHATLRRLLKKLVDRPSQ